MATLSITNGSIVIEFGPWERFFAGRARHTIPLTAVRQASVTRGGPRQLVSVNRHLPDADRLADTIRAVAV
ncbi:MAG: hypothetical protein HOV86_30425 [Thermoactinospora sp.]|nr:hypothetical protein [Thermoactinospora sp.]